MISTLLDSVELSGSPLSTRRVTKGLSCMKKKKMCGGCGLHLDLISFSKESLKPDGLNSRCRNCDSIRNKQWRRSSKQRFASEEYRAKRRIISYAHVAKFPQKQTARVAVANALRTGKLVKLKCQERGCKEKETQAHHIDYKYALTVVWLCIKHHEEIHHKVT